MSKTTFIVNPHSANGQTKRRWPELHQRIKSVLGDRFDVFFTQKPNDAIQLTQEAIKRGSTCVVAVGGDGTINEVVNGFFEHDKPINPDVSFTVLAAGTGSDFIKSAKIPTQIEDFLTLLQKGTRFLCDVGRMSFINHHGDQTIRYFINIADFGFGGAVVERINRTTKIMGGKISYFWNMLVTLVAYKTPKVEIVLEGHAPKVFELMSGVVANGRFFGGGLQVAPMASLTSGTFDVILMEPFKLSEFLKAFPKFSRREVDPDAYKGMEKVYHFKSKRLTAESDSKVLLDVDGEQPGRLPATFEILPGELPVLGE